MTFFKKKRLAVFLIKENETYQVEGAKRIKTNNTVSYHGKTYIINLEKPTYQKGLKTFYFFDLLSGKPLGFENMGEGYDSELIDMVVSKSIIKQLVAQENQFAPNLMIVIICLMVGIMIGYFYTQYTLGGSTTTTTMTGGG